MSFDTFIHSNIHCSRQHFLHFKMTPSVPFKQIPIPHRVKNSYFYSHLLVCFLCFKKIVQTKKYNMYSIVSGWKHRRHGFHPWVGKIPWGRNWQPTPVFFPGKSHGLRSLAGYSPWGHKESDMNEATSHTRIP